MSFSEEVKREITEKTIKDLCCKKAFLSGVMRGNGVICVKDDELGLDFSVCSEEALNQISETLLSVYGYQIREAKVKFDKNGKDKFTVELYGKEAVNILFDLGILNRDFEVDLTLDSINRLIKKECCARSFIKGLFLTSGSCSIPSEGLSKNTGYHLELNFLRAEFASLISGVLSKAGIVGKISLRKGNYILYFKSSEEISDFLAYINCPNAVLKITDLQIKRAIKNDSNRATNCDMGNLNKQIKAAGKIIGEIELIEKVLGKGALKKELQRTADLRREFPSDSLSELAEKLNITKSCLNNRLRTIDKIAKELK